MGLKIIDNFLDAGEFEGVRSDITSPTWPWYHCENITFADNKTYKDSDRSQFIYVLYSEHMWMGAGQRLVAPFMRRLRPLSLFRVKANLQPKTDKVLENCMHTDIGSWVEEAENFMEEENCQTWTPLREMVTGVFYVNSNDGETRFEDGTCVESVANRMVLFPANTMHTGTTCTDEKCRIVINFNYVPLVYPKELVD